MQRRTKIVIDAADDDARRVLHRLRADGNVVQVPGMPVRRDQRAPAVENAETRWIPVLRVVRDSDDLPLAVAKQIAGGERADDESAAAAGVVVERRCRIGGPARLAATAEDENLSGVVARAADADDDLGMPVGVGGTGDD